MGNKVCADTGPILHLHELKKISILNIFSTIFISSIVQDELKHHGLENLTKKVRLQQVNNNQVSLLSQKYGIDIGESSAIWLCKSLKISVLLTDDLAAREVAHAHGIRPVGTIGIILRSYRDGVISKSDALKILDVITIHSSLFVTSNLISLAKQELKKFKRK